MEGRGLAEALQGPERVELLRACDRVDRLTHELADLKARGMVRVSKYFNRNKYDVSGPIPFIKSEHKNSMCSHLIKSIGPKRHTYLYFVALEFFLCYSKLCSSGHL